MARIRPGSLPFPAFGDHPIECLSCGYDLRGLTNPERCPECGVVVSDPAGAGALLTAGLPQVEFGSSGRRWVLFFTVCGWVPITHPATWFLCIGHGMLWMPLLTLVAVAASSAWLIATGPRRTRVTERVVFTRSGIGRTAFGAPQQLGFIAWTHEEVVQARSVGTVWQKLIIRRPTASGRSPRVFEYGFRCQREHLELVRAVVEAMALGTELPHDAATVLAGEAVRLEAQPPKLPASVR